MARIAFLGAGLLGSGMVASALARGEEVSVYNRSPEKAKALEAKGARAFTSAADAVRGAARVHLVLSDDTAVDAVIAAALPGLDPGVVIVDHTTTSPEGTARRIARLAREHRSLVHAPVFMSPQLAAESKGLMLASGPRWLFAKVEPGLAKMTGELVYLGERPDLAAGYKLFGNAMLFAIVGGLADVYTMARSMGVDPEAARGLFAKFQPARSIDLRGAKMARGDFSPSFEVTMARKDVRLMTDLAQGGGVDLRVLPGIAAAFDKLISAGRGAEDMGALAAGVVVEHPPDQPPSARHPIDQLTRSHRRLEETLSELRAATERGGVMLPAVLADAAEYFDQSGRRHEEDEESSLMSRLDDSRFGALKSELITEHAAHHRATKRLTDLADRAARDDGGDVVAEARHICAELDHMYHAHIALEEGVLFPAARLALSADDLTAISREMQARRGR